MQAVKDTLLSIMVAVMPLFNPMLVYALAALGVIGIVLAFMKKGTLALYAGRVLIVMGLVFIACELMGRWLGLQASINFGDANNYEFILYPFWQLGLAMFIGGAVVAVMGRLARDKAFTQG